MASNSLSSRQAAWLLAAGASALAPLVAHLPAWLVALAGIGFLARLLGLWRKAPLPKSWLLTLLALAGCAGILIEYRTLFGQNPGVALLSLFVVLKQFEARAPRDGFAIVFLSNFLALAQFFHSQSIPSFGAMAVTVTLSTAALAALADDRPAPVRQLRLSGRMLMQTLPFMLILFVLFPRVPGPLWGLPRDAFSAMTGLSDSMAPGTIGRLSQSDAIAFRARFAGPPPERGGLYWRGPVLTFFDGITWRPAPSAPVAGLPYAPAGPAFAYEITLEPHNKPWLFALELPGRIPAGGTMTSDYRIISKSPVRARLRYEMQSYPQARGGQTESPLVLKRSLALPADANPRTRAAAEGWRKAQREPEAIVAAAIDFFREQRLEYTLTPPLLAGHAVDGFLFETRQGFCEHFSGAFVFALRAAGVPARVVTGYQGGETNPIDGYMTVRQSDAHAWAEAWIEGKGWMRIDPTAVSAPRRIEMNLAAAVPEGAPLMLRADFGWLRGLRFRWEAVANTWNQWVLGYTPLRQRDFLESLGMQSPDWEKMTALLAALCGLIAAGLLAWTLRPQGIRDPALLLWMRACRRLARRGLPRRPWEGPEDYARRVAGERPEFSAAIQEIAGLYGEVRYGNALKIEELRDRIAAFKP